MFIGFVLFAAVSPAPSGAQSILVFEVSWQGDEVHVLLLG